MGAESRELTPREIIAEQDVEYHESQLIDAKREVEARASFFKEEVEKKEQALEQAEDSLRNASGRLERYGSNPRVEQERDAAEAMVVQATEKLAESRKELARFSDAAATL